MSAQRFQAHSRSCFVQALLLLGCMAAVHCSTGSGWTTSDPAVVSALDSVVVTAVRRSDAEGAQRFLEVEREFSAKLRSADYGQLANDLLDLSRPIAARTVLDSAERRFGADPEVADQIQRLRERVRLVEIQLELTSPEIDD